MFSGYDENDRKWREAGSPSCPRCNAGKMPDRVCQVCGYPTYKDLRKMTPGEILNHIT